MAPTMIQKRLCASPTCGAWGCAMTHHRKESPPKRAFFIFPQQALIGEAPVLGLADEERADDERCQRHHDRVPQAMVDVPGGRDHRERRGGQESAEPAVADV